MGILESAVAQRVRRSPALRPPAIATYRVIDRLLPAPPGPRVVCNSMPKSGTHLLATLLDQLTRMRFNGQLITFDGSHAVEPERPLADIDRTLRRIRPSRYVGGHLMYDPRIEQLVAASGVKLVTILRDPRAIVLSGAHYVSTAAQLRGRDRALELFPDLDSILRAMVFGHGEPGEEFYSPEIGERFRSYAAWQQSAAGLVILFEDLVGVRGGGTADRQVETVARVLDHLGYSESQVSPSELAGRLFSPDAVTFRAGRIDSWRDELPTELADEIVVRCGEDMARLGFPTS
jgi:hypothetical protein